MSVNGLKLNAILDSDEVAGPHLNRPVEFRKGLMPAHGLAHGEHVLENIVGSPRKRQNKYPKPTGNVAQPAGRTPPDRGHRQILFERPVREYCKAVQHSCIITRVPR